MSILGLTIDYGPYGFLENFDSNYVSNGSDKMYLLNLNFQKILYIEKVKKRNKKKYMKIT